MKSLARGIFFNALSLFLLTLILPGIKVYGGFATFIIAGFFLTLMYKILKPILNLVSLPLNILSLGMFSFFINVIIFYLATILVPNISISEFTYPGFTLVGFVVPKISFNTFFAFVIISAFHSVFVNFFTWFFKR